MKNILYIVVFNLGVGLSSAYAQEKQAPLIMPECKVVAPNAFTPNDDGVNDYFFLTLTGECEVVSFEMKIYDRWGRLVFTADDASNEWDGTYDGQQLKEGVYLWQTSVKWGSTEGQERLESKKGSLVLIR